MIAVKHRNFPLFFEKLIRFGYYAYDGGLFPRSPFHTSSPFAQLFPPTPCDFSDSCQHAPRSFHLRLSYHTDYLLAFQYQNTRTPSSSICESDTLVKYGLLINASSECLGLGLFSHRHYLSHAWLSLP